MKNIKKNGIILAIITFIVLFLVLKDDFPNIINLLNNANRKWLLLAFIMQALQIIFEVLSFHQVLKSYKKDYHLKKTLSLSLMSKFFNGITPFSTGGQPMQVYFLNKDGLRVTKATNAILQNFILYQTALITIGIVAILLNAQNNYFAQNPLLRKLVILGFLVNTLVMVVLFIISFNNKFNKKIVESIINILTKLKIEKNPEEAKNRWLERCNDFHEGATFIKKHKWLCLKGFIYNILALIFFYSVPFFVIKALNQTITLDLLIVLVATSYVAIMGAFVPIPGASGGIEFGYLQFFGNFISGSLLSASLLIWRAITYYIPMIIGAIVVNIRKDDKK